MTSTSDARSSGELAGCHAVRMRRQKSLDRQTRLREFHETLPPMQRGVVITVLLGNALLVVTVDGLLAVAVIRGAVRSWGHRGFGPAAAVRIGIGPALGATLVGAAMQWVVAEGLIRAVETGRAGAWLERSERWLTASAGDQDRRQ